MLSYITKMDHIDSVVNDLDIDHDVIPRLSDDQRTSLAEYIFLLSEVRRVT